MVGCACRLVFPFIYLFLMVKYKLCWSWSLLLQVKQWKWYKTKTRASRPNYAIANNEYFFGTLLAIRTITLIDHSQDSKMNIFFVYYWLYKPLLFIDYSRSHKLIAAIVMFYVSFFYLYMELTWVQWFNKCSKLSC